MTYPGENLINYDPLFYLSLLQCDQIWRIIATLQNLYRFCGVYLLFGKILELLWQILYGIGKFFIHVNGRMLKNNLAIWSHCPPFLC